MKKILLTLSFIFLSTACQAEVWNYWLQLSTPSYLINGAVGVKGINTSTSTCKLWLYPNGTVIADKIILRGVDIASYLDNVVGVSPIVTAETNARIAGDAALRISTTTITANLTTEINARSTADRNIGISTGAIQSALSTHSHAASVITSGIISDTVKISTSSFNITGTASSSTYVRGDGTWASPTGNTGSVDSPNPYYYFSPDTYLKFESGELKLYVQGSFVQQWPGTNIITYINYQGTHLVYNGERVIY